jgi:hypothetical protein
MEAKDKATSLMYAAGDYGAEVLEQFRVEQPQMFLGLAKLFAAGYAEFDLTVRGVTGGAPLLELYVRTTRGSELVATQQLSRPDAKPAGLLFN